MGINIQLLEKVERLRREERDVIKKKIKDNEFYKILIKADIISEAFDLAKADLDAIKHPLDKYSTRFDDASCLDVSLDDSYWVYKENDDKRFRYNVVLNAIIVPDYNRLSRVVVMDNRTAEVIAQLELTPYKKKYKVDYRGFNPYKNQPEKAYTSEVDVLEKLISPFTFTGYDWKWKWSNLKYPHDITKLEGDSLFEESYNELSMMFAHKFEQYRFKAVSQDDNSDADSTVSTEADS